MEYYAFTKQEWRSTLCAYMARMLKYTVKWKKKGMEQYVWNTTVCLRKKNLVSIDITFICIFNCSGRLS